MSPILALHSSTSVLAVALRDPAAGAPDQLREFALGRQLSSALFDCVEAVLPAARWKELARLAVATGPGGFTGTRLTVVMARTLAQQLAIPLDGVGSFLLAACCLELDQPTWLVQELPRRGVVAGCYAPSPGAESGVQEWHAPRLYPHRSALSALEPAATLQSLEPDAGREALQLLAIADRRHRQRQPGPWEPVLPLYPTAPVPL